jgi:hypothetical protein
MPVGTIVYETSGFGTPRTRFATQYVFATLSSALRAGISERDQQGCTGQVYRVAVTNLSRPKPVFESRSRFCSHVYKATRCLAPKNAARLKHAARCSLELSGTKSRDGFEPNPFTSKNTGGSAARKNPAWDTESSFGLRQTPMDVFEPVRMALAVTPRA